MQFERARDGIDTSLQPYREEHKAARLLERELDPRCAAAELVPQPLGDIVYKKSDVTSLVVAGHTAYSLHELG